MGHIVAVDDDVTILKYCAITLKALGHQVSIFPDPYGALLFLQLQPADLIIVDLVMPGLDGFEFLTTLKKIEIFKGPVLMLTGKRSGEDVMTALKLGVNEYLVKPFDKDVMIQKVEALLPKKNALPSGPSVSLHEKSNATHICSRDLLISEVSEAGLKIRSKHFISLQGSINLDTDLFDRIGISPPQFKIKGGSLISPKDEFPFESFFEFHGVNDRDKIQLRYWIAKNQTISPKT